MILAAGVLAALAFTALPAVSSAQEYLVDCETGAQCEGTIAGGAGVLSNTTNETVSCTSVHGIAKATSGSATGSFELTFTGCRETVTFFKFGCNSAGAASQTIKTGALVSHMVNLSETGGTVPGILVTNSNVTFECAGFSKKTVTGNVLGTIENEGNVACDTTFDAQTKADFTQTSHGQQTHKKYTGKEYDLTSSAHDGVYHTSAQTGTGTITWTKNKVRITC
jgi:hypothetical protein